MEVFLLVLAVAVLVWVQRPTIQPVLRPLSARQPERREQDVPLGMEALDLDEVSRTNRLNESLERGQTNWLTRTGFFGRPDTDVQPLADDETYAARYYNAFQKDKIKDQ